MSNALFYIGIARKAGAIEVGETNSGNVTRAGKARLLVLASDASDNAQSRAEGFVFGRNTPLVRLPFTKEELSQTTGANGCSMAAFTDIGLASAFMERLSQTQDGYKEVSEQLKVLNEKALARKREAATHEKKKKAGKTAAAGLRRKTK